MKPEYGKTKYVTPDWGKVSNKNLTKGKAYRIKKWDSPGSFRISTDLKQEYIGSIHCWKSVDFEVNLKKILKDA